MTKTENRKKAPVEVVDRQSVTPLVFSQELNVGESDIASAVIHRYGPTCILFSLTGEHPVDGEACTASADMSASQAKDLISMLTKALRALTTKKTPAEIASSLSPAQCRFHVGERQRCNDCTSNMVATMKALEARGLGKRQRIGYGSGRPDYIWDPSDLGRAVAAELKKPS